MKTLTETQRQIENLILTGLTNKEIASQRQISVRTAKFHAGKIYANRGVTSRLELLAAALRNAKAAEPQA